MKQDRLEEKKRTAENPFARAAQAVLGFKWGYLLFAAMLIAAGVCFILYPLEATKGVSITVGAVAVAFSLVGVVMSLADKCRGFRFWVRTLTMMLGVVTGVVVIILSCTGHGAWVFRALVLILAVYMIVDGSFKLQTAILSRRYRFWLWWVLLILVVISIGMGVFALYNGSNLGVLVKSYPKLLPRLVGGGFVIDGILNLLSILFLYKIENGQRDEVIQDLRDKGMIVTVEDVTEPVTVDGEEPENEAQPAELTDNDKPKVTEKKKRKKKTSEPITAVVPFEEERH